MPDSLPPDYHDIPSSPLPANMTREEAAAFIQERIISHQNKVATKLLWWIVSMIAGGVLSIITGTSVWFQTKGQVAINKAAVDELKPKVESLQLWRATVDEKNATKADFADLDKKLQRVDLQTVTILEQLRKIESRLP